MTIVRREHRAQFTIVPNAIFLDDRLSIEAKGVLGYLLSRPHSWQVRLDHVGRTLRIGRKKLQRIFRELIGAGYVTREQPRTAEAHRFREIDYVVRDVPLAPIHPADEAPGPRGGKGPAEPRGRKGPAYKEEPQVRNGPAYKELDNKKRSERSEWFLRGLRRGRLAGTGGARTKEPSTRRASMPTSLPCLTIGARDGSCSVCSPTRFWRGCASASAVASSTRLRWSNSGCATDTSCRIDGQMMAQQTRHLAIRADARLSPFAPSSR